MRPFGDRFLLTSQQTLQAEDRRVESPPLVLPIGRERYRIEGLPPAVRAQLAAKYEDLIVNDGQGEALVLRVRLTPSWNFVEIDPNLLLMDFDQQFYEHEVQLAGRNLFGRFRIAPSRAGTVWVSDSEGPLWEDLIGNCLRLMVAYSSLEPGGALLHSAAVIVDGAARLFVGNRDSGKTSLSRLALERGLTVLSDDLNVFRPLEADRFELIKMPFAGELGRTTGEAAGSWPIASLHLLADASQASDPMSLAQALASLVAASCFLNRDPHRYAVLTDNLLALARHCRPQWLDPTDQRALDRLLLQRGGHGAGAPAE